MNTFRVTYTDGTSYVTSANSDLEDFAAYISGNPHVSEDYQTGEETYRYVATVEQIA